jgi:hypothetical protein
MTRVSELADHWFGLCRKPPVIRTLPADIAHLPVSAWEGLPDGGGGGSGTIRRGIGSAISGMRTLNHNRQLLWFALLAGLVLAGNAIGQTARYILAFNSHLHPGIIGSYALEFFIEFATVFCLVYLLAGLVLSVSSKNDGSASFFVGLAGAKKYITPIFLWSVVLALAGLLLYYIWFFGSPWLPGELQFLHIYGFTGTLSDFPFNFLTLNPAKFSEIPGYGGRSLLLWIYPYGIEDALSYSAINLFLFLLTPFVVPFIVLEQKTLREAVVGSFAMMKKTCVEIAACAVFLGIVVYGVFLMSLLVQAAHGMLVTPIEVFTYRPSVMWLTLGLLYDLALLSLAFITATIGGIAALDLYHSAKGGHMPGSVENTRR